MRMKIGNTYQIKGTDYTVERLPWCFRICRGGEVVTTRSTRKLALDFIRRELTRGA